MSPKLLMYMKLDTTDKVINFFRPPRIRRSLFKKTAMEMNHVEAYFMAQDARNGFCRLSSTQKRKYINIKEHKQVGNDSIKLQLL